LRDVIEVRGNRCWKRETEAGNLAASSVLAALQPNKSKYLRLLPVRLGS
jgi:hypothetical protein